MNEIMGFVVIILFIVTFFMAGLAIGYGLKRNDGTIVIKTRKDGYEMKKMNIDKDIDRLAKQTYLTLKIIEEDPQ